jgi:perosamine synthetase
MIPVYKPRLKSLKYAHNALESTWISSQGYYLDAAVDKLKEIWGSERRIVLTNNGTTAMHLVSKCLHYRHPEFKSLVVPNNVYVAAWNAFLYDKEFNLFPVDASPTTWNMSKEYLKGVDAVLCVHNLGNTINVPKLQRDYGVVTVEDNCEGFGGSYEGRPTGTASLCSATSFFGNKNVTSGEGGAFVTDDEELYLYAKKLHGQGMSDRKFVHDVLGYNYRMTNIEAAILLGELEGWEETKEMKQNLFDTYKNMLADIPHIRFQVSEDNTIPSNWMFGVRFLGGFSYNKAFSYFTGRGIEVRPMFYPMSSHEYLKEYARTEDMAKVLNNQVVIFPSYPGLEYRDLVEITEAIKGYAKWIEN